MEQENESMIEVEKRMRERFERAFARLPPETILQMGEKLTELFYECIEPMHETLKPLMEAESQSQKEDAGGSTDG